MSPYAAVGKRVCDIVISGTALLVLSPVMIATWFAVRLRLGSPAVFKQARLGRDGKPFTILKFRTMTDRTGADGMLLPDAERLTTLGRMLRELSLDELPELVNVLRGEMSLVGPRPLYARYGARYTPEQKRRHEVLPGLTGLAQVSGRNLLSWEEKFRLDVWYVDHVSMQLDLKIALRTVQRIIAREGIAQDGKATADEFLGPGSD